MPGYQNQYARSRNRRPGTAARRQPDPGDAIVAVIAIQVIICLVLIVAFVAYKQMNREGYDGFKAQYTNMTSDAAAGELGNLLGQAADGVNGAVSTVEQFFAGLFGAEKSGGSDAPALPEGGASSQEEDDIAEPTDPPAAGPESGESAVVPSFNYDYLAVEPLGRGGWFPVGENDADTNTVPAGSTLDPVYLNAHMQPPVTGVVSSAFGFRDHPVSQTADFHTGMDIAAEEGRAILCALPGEVIEVGESAIYGNYITVRHADNLETSYAHCSEIIAAEGMIVRQGERIAKVGQTGLVTGPHLHFSVIVEGQYADPYWVLKDDLRLLEE